MKSVAMQQNLKIRPKSVSAPKNLTDNSVNNGLYTSRSLTRSLLEVPAVSRSQGFDWENFGVLDWRSLMGGGSLRGAVAHGDATVDKVLSFIQILHRREGWY